MWRAIGTERARQAQPISFARQPCECLFIIRVFGRQNSRNGEIDTFMGIWEAGLVKTTLEIPDELFREAKAKAALEGRKLKDLVTEGLRLRMSQPPKENPKRVQFPLIKSKSKRLLKIPDDIASRVELADDLRRYETSLR